MNKTIVLALLALGLLSVLPAMAQQEKNVVVKPEETDEILANPGMGWETFQSRAKDDKNLPDWIPSTIYYIRWGWIELEPQPGKLNTEVARRHAEGSSRLGPEARVSRQVLLQSSP